METWIIDQILKKSSTFDLEMEKNSSDYTSDPYKYFNRVCRECNYLDAVENIRWSKYIKEDSKVLDLAGGTGWLSAYLSKNSDVKSITLVDLSKQYLSVNLPVSVELLNGDLSKIHTIEGFFTPLLLEDEQFDLIVVSSSLHHAENLEEVLIDLHRVLKTDGYCLILNETPVSQLLYLRIVILSFLRILKSILVKFYTPISPKISASGYLYDPHLGDIMYPTWYWKKAIHTSGLSLVETVDSGLSTVKKVKGLPLTHFICKKDQK